MEAQAWRTQRRPPIIRDSAAHGQAIPADGCRFRVLAPFQRPFERAYATDLFLQFRLGMVIGLEDWPSRFLEVVVVAELVGNLRKHGRDGGANGSPARQR